ncbi:MAG: flagellar basal body-associated FliL family protein [Alphaproteobacteria bacterium]|nr:flagellar basal body-associated FliL family protein [Alphaproteobacteria bacterium]
MAEDDEKNADEPEKEEGEGSAEAAEAEAAKKKKKLIIIGGAAAGAVVILGIVLALALGGGKESSPAAGEVKAESASGEPIYYPLGDMIVNLSGGGKRPNYLKVKVTLELADKRDSGLMDLIKPRIIDNFQVYLRELRIEDLRGSAGMYRLREELLTRVTEAAQPIRVRDVLFQEMLVQ